MRGGVAQLELANLTGFTQRMDEGTELGEAVEAVVLSRDLWKALACFTVSEPSAKVFSRRNFARSALRV